MAKSSVRSLEIGKGQKKPKERESAVRLQTALELTLWGLHLASQRERLTVKSSMMAKKSTEKPTWKGCRLVPWIR